MPRIRRPDAIWWITALATPLLLMAASIAAVSGSEPQTDEQLAASSDLVLGLDGAAYPPYKPSAIEWVQNELKDRELYEGKVDGKLDQSTKEAIAKFQKDHDIHASGIPSPRTRSALGRAEPTEESAMARGDEAENDHDHE
ncbi:MAG: peptidoglycan-binding domain-containing protein [Acidobacteriota bacterium]|jgi:peptidoglycan hydrolase-like protein with peptidoglycan-binding domain